jgi:hypothetical protein
LLDDLPYVRSRLLKLIELLSQEADPVGGGVEGGKELSIIVSVA